MVADELRDKEGCMDGPIKCTLTFVDSPSQIFRALLIGSGNNEFKVGSILSIAWMCLQ